MEDKMVLAITELLRAVNPNMGLVVNPDGSYRIGVEDVNSDEILVAAAALAVDLAAIEIINTAINTALQAGGITQVQLAAMVTALGFIRNVPITTNTTGTNAALATLSPGAAFKLVAVRVHISTGAPLAAAETLTVTLDADAGAAYDTVLFSSDLGTAGINDVVIEFGEGYEFAAADDIVIALSANAGGDTWGCQTIHRLI